ncbi:MAG: hypothetical protein IK041_04275 [Bacteroidales bacterium]|nr:hypothetical protein [Bacteroidales bacterium]
MKGLFTNLDSEDGTQKTGSGKNELRGCLPQLQRAFLTLLLCGLFYGVVSCIKQLDESQRESNKPDDQKSGLAALSFYLDRASYDSCLVIAEDMKESMQSNTLLSDGDYLSSFAVNPLDSNSYRLSIINSSGVAVYDSSYVGRPDTLYVKAGTYKVRVVSRDFTEPDIYPLFGQEQSVKAKKDSTMRVAIVSRQLTGGIRFSFTPAFMSWFKGTGIYLKRDTLQTKYFYGTRHYVYLYPGEISVIYKNKDGHSTYTPPDNPGYADTVLFKRKLKATELVTITLDYDLTKVISGGFSFSVDTARIRKDEYFNLGGIAPYGCSSVLYAQTHIGDTINLFGYIVGGDATSTTFRKVKPFSSKTNIVIGAQDWQSLREKTVAVELANGNIRQELNLVDHPEHLKKPLVVSGVVTDSYFGYPGLKNVSSYQLLK